MLLRLKSRKYLIGRLVLLSWLASSFFWWTAGETVLADPPTVLSSCSLKKLTDDLAYVYSINARGQLAALASLSSESGRMPWASAYTQRFWLLKTKKKTSTPIGSFSSEGRAQIPSVQISSNGTRVVFASTGDPTGENADRNSEIFLFDVKKKKFSQITHTTAVDNFSPVISGNGKRVAYLATVNPTGEIAESSTTLFLFDSVTKIQTQVIQATGGFSSLFYLAISGNGVKIAFASNVDPIGGNADGTWEIFLWDTTTHTFSQLTNTVRTETNSGNSFSPAISADGTRIVFNSVFSPTGENAGGNNEIFLFDTRTGIFTQLTHTTGNSGLFSQSSISADGTKVVFEGDKDLLTGNIDNVLDGNDTEIFLFDTTTNTLTQLTHSNGMSRTPVISADGNHIMFSFARYLATFLVGGDVYGYNSDYTPPLPDPATGLYMATCP